MKKWKYVFLMACLLVLAACGSPQTEDNSAPTEEELPPLQQEEIVPQMPAYEFDILVCTDRYLREDTGAEAGFYCYNLPLMKVANEENLTEDDAEQARRNVENFNARMNEVMNELQENGKELLEEQKFLVETENVPFTVCDEVTASTSVMGQIVTVVADCYYYGGGAHPSSFVVTYTYDLSVGQFIDPAQIGDDPEQFRVSAAELLILRAESMGEEYVSGFWSDYRDIIARWNETAVIFDETGMTVYFSAYELGPYAMGPVELTIDYETLAAVIGEGGMAHLGF